MRKERKIGRYKQRARRQSTKMTGQSDVQQMNAYLTPGVRARDNE